MSDHQLLWGCFAFLCFLLLLCVAYRIARRNGNNKKG